MSFLTLLSGSFLLRFDGLKDSSGQWLAVVSSSERHLKSYSYLPDNLQTESLAAAKNAAFHNLFFF